MLAFTFASASMATALMEAFPPVRSSKRSCDSRKETMFGTHPRRNRAHARKETLLAAVEVEVAGNPGNPDDPLLLHDGEGRQVVERLVPTVHPGVEHLLILGIEESESLM